MSRHISDANSLDSKDDSSTDGKPKSNLHEECRALDRLPALAAGITIYDKKWTDGSVPLDTVSAGLAKLGKEAIQRRDIVATGAAKALQKALATESIVRSLRSFAVVGVDPGVMGIGPAFAIPKAVKSAGLKLDDINLFEINEAFASQYVFCCKNLNLDTQKVNVNEGALALRHPLGATEASSQEPFSINDRRRQRNVGDIREGGKNGRSRRKKVIAVTGTFFNQFQP